MTSTLTIFEAFSQAATHPLTGALFLLLAVAAVSDARTYRIPNWLTLTGVVYGLVCNALMHESMFAGVMFGLQGMLLCFALIVPMYVLGSMGAGDVKLISMIGAFVGMPSALGVILSIFIAGGALGVAMLVSRRANGLLRDHLSGFYQQMGTAQGHFSPVTEVVAQQGLGKLPFGVGIALGTVAYVVARLAGLF